MNGVSRVRRTSLYIGYEVPIMHSRTTGDVTVFRFFFRWFGFFLLGWIEFDFVRNVGGCGRLDPGGGAADVS